MSWSSSVQGGAAHSPSSLSLPLRLWFAGVVLAWAGTGLWPYDRATWFMETFPVLIVFPLLFLTRRSFPLTHLLYFFIGLHALVLIWGGACTYARVPLGFWIQDWLHLSRNPYDRIGHFMQGFVPALAAREILLRRRVVRGAGWCNFLVLCICLAFSAFYELLEWWTALAWGQKADDFLATQGDPWDTQWDMFTALIGAATSLVVLGPVHDRALARRAARELEVGKRGEA